MYKPHQYRIWKFRVFKRPWATGDLRQLFEHGACSLPRLFLPIQEEAPQSRILSPIFSSAWLLYPTFSTVNPQLLLEAHLNFIHHHSPMGYTAPAHVFFVSWREWVRLSEWDSMMTLEKTQIAKTIDKSSAINYGRSNNYLIRFRGNNVRKVIPSLEKNYAISHNINLCSSTESLVWGNCNRKRSWTTTNIHTPPKSFSYAKFDSVTNTTHEVLALIEPHLISEPHHRRS